MDAHHGPNLAQALELTSQGDGFVASVSSSWSQGRAAFGGLVAALGVRALAHRVPEERVLRSLLVDFVGPVNPGPVQIRVAVLREGRALTHAEARLLQDGQTCAVLLGAYGAARSSSLEVRGAEPAAAPEALSLPRAPYVEGSFPAFSKHFDYRWSSPDFPFAGAARGRIEGYVRHASPAHSDVAGLLCLIDAWPPALLPMLKQRAPASSVTWMVDLLAPECLEAHPWDAFYRYAADTIAAGHGYGSTESRLWAPDGTLVAASRQLVVEFSS